MGTHLIVLSESYLMNTNMTGFIWFSKEMCILVIWTKVASALEGLRKTTNMVPHRWVLEQGGLKIQVKYTGKIIKFSRTEFKWQDYSVPANPNSSAYLQIPFCTIT